MAFASLTVPPPDLDRAASRWYVVRSGELLVSGDGDPPVAAEAPMAPGRQADTDGVFLGTDGEAGCWAVGADPDAEAPTGMTWAPLLDLGTRWGADSWSIGGRAVQLVEWLRTTRHCGRCGTATTHDTSERAMRCPVCGLTAYPRLAPAVIVLVHRGEEMLLARNGRFRGSMFSTVAGFVEPGETLEQTVHREVAEEVGVRLGNMRYVGSQPWPFPHSLMVGFDADWADGDIRVDGEEIVEAGWFRADALPRLPPRLSIARTLIDGFLERTAR